MHFARTVIAITLGLSLSNGLIAEEITTTTPAAESIASMDEASARAALDTALREMKEIEKIINEDEAVIEAKEQSSAAYDALQAKANSVDELAALRDTRDQAWDDKEALGRERARNEEDGLDTSDSQTDFDEKVAAFKQAKRDYDSAFKSSANLQDEHEALGLARQNVISAVRSARANNDDWIKLDERINALRKHLQTVAE